MRGKSLFVVLLCIFGLFLVGPAFAQETITEDQDTQENIAAPDQTAPEEPAVPVIEEENPDQDQGAQPAESEDDQPQKGKTPKKSPSKESAVSATVSGGGSGTQKNGFSAPPVPDTYVYTGAAGYSIPIEVPPGRNGLAPNLKLTYNSYRGNSWVGVGWDLDLGAIRRSTKHGLSYSADNFVFEGAGSSEELVSGTTTWGANYYRAKIEGEFSKYYYNTGTNGWEVTAKDGTRYFYGSTVPSRQDSALGVFKWCLDKIEDTNGNYLTVTYTKDQGEIYLDRIDYTGHSGLAPSSYVRFYLENRNDAAHNYETQNKVVTAKRLKSIAVRANNNPVRVYKLTYIDNNGTVPRSVLSELKEYGSDTIVDANGGITSGSALPATVLEYQQITDGFPGTQWVLNYASGTGAVHAQGDFLGNGRTDFILAETDSYNRISNINTMTQVYLSNGQGGFQKVTNAFEYSGQNPAIHVQGDFDGDGRMDFMIAETDEYGRMTNPNSRTIVYLSNGNGTFRQVADPFSHAYSSCKAQMVGDFNGDGRTDFILADTSADGRIFNPNTRTYAYLSNGNGTFRQVANPFTYPQGGTMAQVIGDFNADGKTDFILTDTWTDGRIWNPNSMSYTYLSNGDGTFRQVANPFTYPAGSGCKAHVIGDFNGDGRTDFILTDTLVDGRMTNLATTTYGFLSKGDGTFAQVASPFYYPNGGSKVHVSGDFDGDGKTDFIVADTSADGRIFNPNTLTYAYLAKGDGTFLQVANPFYYIQGGSKVHAIGDFNADGKTDFLLADTTNNKIVNPTSMTYVYQAKPGIPGLLKEISNSLGGSAAIGYTPSSAYQNTNLPFIVHTVSGVTVNDGLGNQAISTYTYSGGYYDAAEREFRGFASAKKTNPDLTTEETRFKQDKYFQGKPYQTEFRETAGGSLLSGTTLTWTKIDYTGNDFSFVKLAQKKFIQYENSIQTAFTQEDNTYDDTNGNLLTTVTQGTDAENLTKTNQYQNSGAWVWRTTQETLTGSTSGKVRENYYTYENNTGNLSTKSSWLQGGTNPIINMTYDDYGNVRYLTDARGNTTETQCDSTNTYPVKVIAPTTNGVTHITEAGWNYLFGAPAWGKDENLNVTNYQYDLFGRTKQIDFPDNGQIVYQYYDNEFPRKLVTRVKEDTAPHYIDKTGYFDGLGRSIQTATLGEENKAIITRTYYDDMGRADLSEGPFFATGSTYPQQPPTAYAWTRLTYDKRSRPILVEKPHGDYTEPVTTSFIYAGLSTTITDPDNSRKTEKKDYLSRIIEVVEYENTNEYHTTYAYNAAGDLLTVTNTYGKQTVLIYDTLGRKKEMTDPDMGHWTYTYDPNANLLTQTDAKNQVITFTYDALNRVLTKSNGTTYAYDNLTANANGRGRVYSVTKGTTNNTNNSYDKMGRVTSATRAIGANNYTTQTAYDLSGKTTQVIYPDSHVVNTTYYPGTGLVQTVSSGTTNYGIFTDYEPSGKIGQVDHANNTATLYTYDPWSTKLFGIVTQDPSGQPANDLQNKSYHYTRAGDIDQITDHKKNITYTYTYDPLHRLKTENGGPEAISYTYNAVGSILTRTIGTKTFTYSYNNAAHVHAVSSVAYNGNNYAFNYDANGNLTSGSDLSNIDQVVTRTVTYDVDNMPTQIVRSSTTVNFTYDGIGTRIKKAVEGGSTTLYIGTHYEVKAGVITKYIFGGNLRLAVIKGSLTYYYHKDHLGSTGAITDSTGAKVESAEYQPFGTMREHTGSNVSDYKFTDQELDNETNLYNYDARLYDPVLGMFVTPDSIVPNLFDPQTLNRYSYCKNNPLIYTDPTGHHLGDCWNGPRKETTDFEDQGSSIGLGNNPDYHDPNRIVPDDDKKALGKQLGLKSRNFFVPNRQAIVKQARGELNPDGSVSWDIDGHWDDNSPFVGKDRKTTSNFVNETNAKIDAGTFIDGWHTNFSSQQKMIQERNLQQALECVANPGIDMNPPPVSEETMINIAIASVALTATVATAGLDMPVAAICVAVAGEVAHFVNELCHKP